MSIPMNYQCYLCHFNKNVADARRFGDDDTATAFARDLMKLYLSAPENASLTWFGAATNDLFQKYFDLPEDRFSEEKEMSNRFVIQRMDIIRSRVESAVDPVFAGLQYAILGNYIDFSALHGQVSFQLLEELLTKADTFSPKGDAYAQFCDELSGARNLLYLTDNAGEIGFDRIFAEQIQKKYPHLAITFCVKGGPAANDALRADAEAVGIPFPVIDSGVSLSGMELTRISEEAKKALEEADVILSKGQANVESLYGSGYNIYFAFLVKCQRFIDLFGQEKFTPMLIRDKK